MCRVWLNGVPATQQPAPTTCAQAVKVHAPNGHVIFGATGSGGALARPMRVSHVATPPPNVDSRLNLVPSTVRNGTVLNATGATPNTATGTNTLQGSLNATSGGEHVQAKAVYTAPKPLPRPPPPPPPPPHKTSHPGVRR